jgi:hypothetical protein
VAIYNKTAGTRLVNADIASIGQVIDLKEGHNLVRLRIEQLHLNPDVYALGLWLQDKGLKWTPLDYLEVAFEIEVVQNESEDFGISENSPVSCKFKILEVT